MMVLLGIQDTVHYNIVFIPGLVAMNLYQEVLRREGPRTGTEVPCMMQSPRGHFPSILFIIRHQGGFRPWTGILAGLKTGPLKAYMIETVIFHLDLWTGQTTITIAGGGDKPFVMALYALSSVCH